MFIFEKGELKLTNVPVPLVTRSGMERIGATDILLDTGRSYILDRIHPPENRLRWPEISEEEYSAENIELNKYARGLFLSQKIIERWKEEAEAEGRRLILVLIPTRQELEWYRSYLVRMKENLAGKGLEIVDCREVFRERDRQGVSLFQGNHPSSRGQETVAELVYSYLADTGSFPLGNGAPGERSGKSSRP